MFTHLFPFKVDLSSSFMFLLNLVDMERKFKDFNIFIYLQALS